MVAWTNRSGQIAYVDFTESTQSGVTTFTDELSDAAAAARPLPA